MWPSSPACCPRNCTYRGELKPLKTYEERDVELNARALAALRRHVHALARRAQPARHLLEARATPVQAARAPGLQHPAHLLDHLPDEQLHPAWVARQLGHKNSKMVHEICVRWIDGADKSRERERLDAALAISRNFHETTTKLTTP